MLSSLECFADNLDLSSSGPSLLIGSPKPIGAMVGKDGRIRVFDPYSLPGLASMKSEDQQLSTAHYGQVGLIYDNKKAKPYLFAATGGFKGMEHPRALGTNEENSEDLQSKKCSGFALKSGKIEQEVLLVSHGDSIKLWRNVPRAAPEFKKMLAPKAQQSFGLKDRQVEEIWLPFRQEKSRFFLADENQKMPEGDWLLKPYSWIQTKAGEFYLVKSDLATKITNKNKSFHRFHSQQISG